MRVFVIICVLLTAFATCAIAQSVYIPEQAKPEDVVGTRKFAMRALNSNLRDIRLKIKRGDTDGILTPSLNISAIARLAPYVFSQRYETVYPYPGSNRYFKGAKASDFQANAEYLNVQSSKLLRLGANLPKIKKQFERIKRACVSCHTQLRGEY